MADEKVSEACANCGGTGKEESVRILNEVRVALNCAPMNCSVIEMAKKVVTERDTATKRAEEAEAKYASLTKAYARVVADRLAMMKDRDTLAERLGRVVPLVKACRKWQDAHGASLEELNALRDMSQWLPSVEAALANAPAAPVPSQDELPIDEEVLVAWRKGNESGNTSLSDRRNIRKVLAYLLDKRNNKS